MELIELVAALTESQSQVVLFVFGVVIILLIVGFFSSLRRIIDLERVVYKSSQKTKKLSDVIDEVKAELE